MQPIQNSRAANYHQLLTSPYHEAGDETHKRAYQTNLRQLALNIGQAASEPSGALDESLKSDIDVLIGEAAHGGAAGLEAKLALCMAYGKSDPLVQTYLTNAALQMCTTKGVDATMLSVTVNYMGSLAQSPPHGMNGEGTRAGLRQAISAKLGLQSAAMGDVISLGRGVLDHELIAAGKSFKTFSVNDSVMAQDRNDYAAVWNTRLESAVTSVSKDERAVFWMSVGGNPATACIPVMVERQSDGSPLLHPIGTYGADGEPSAEQNHLMARLEHVFGEGNVKPHLYKLPQGATEGSTLLCQHLLEAFEEQASQAKEQTSTTQFLDNISTAWRAQPVQQSQSQLYATSSTLLEYAVIEPQVTLHMGDNAEPSLAANPQAMVHLPAEPVPAQRSASVGVFANSSVKDAAATTAKKDVATTVTLGAAFAAQQLHLEGEKMHWAFDEFPKALSDGIRSKTVRLPTKELLDLASEGLKARNRNQWAGFTDKALNLAVAFKDSKASVLFKKSGNTPELRMAQNALQAMGTDGSFIVELLSRQKVLLETCRLAANANDETLMAKSLHDIEILHALAVQKIDIAIEKLGNAKLIEPQRSSLSSGQKNAEKLKSDVAKLAGALKQFRTEITGDAAPGSRSPASNPFTSLVALCREARSSAASLTSAMALFKQVVTKQP